MSTEISRTFESTFGPSSEPISISEFRKTAKTEVNVDVKNSSSSWQRLSQSQQQDIEQECNRCITEVKSTLETAWDNPSVSGYLMRTHDATISELQNQAGIVSESKGARRSRSVIPDAQSWPAVATDMKEKLEAIEIRSWPYTADATWFIRTPKNSDHNAITRVKASAGSGNNPKAGAAGVGDPEGGDVSTCSDQEITDPPAVITVTVHNCVSWAHSILTRSSQHVVLSSQTLADLIEVVPCPSKKLLYDQDTIDSSSGPSIQHDEGCLVCIEGLAYGDGREEDEYAANLIAQLDKLPAEKRPPLQKAGTSLANTTIDTLSLRVNQPYWMLHQGNCEHYLVVDEIRLRHSADPKCGYPLTTQITPTLLDMCRACSRVPAAYSIIGDLRVGESPCPLCGPCWRNLGPSEGVTVVPLLTHEETEPSRQA
ncbi:hypothetical protein CONPUDRAFT_101736 [Coniophora puteana RWD-64-598 SS2]|uniref:snRNA-activating protein complex subunit 3 n=1 Tax=Coniophora puteana (strain RWD-64-598) TaxID=741705 RepID=A0A5M3MVG4_CONPW|nr:uncharacterized protein CONPUDRAFT_101736 [Coniophora puteana RWD-64-598 SS2]EIW83123.1 hypothetical protein CONPUDRAFT_101736 [Coniophora puteana RWD-64-598 SS2]